MRLRRFFGLGALLAVGPLGPAQTAEPMTGLFAEVRPQIMIVVRQHVAGSELLEITAIEPNYPTELLRSQAEQLGKVFGGEAKALTVYYTDIDPGSPNLRFLKATLAIDGLILPDGDVLLTPLIRAFTGVPEPHVIKGMALSLEGIKPTAKTVRNFTSPAVAVEGRYQRDPEMLDYRIRIDSQKADEITVALAAPRTERKTTDEAPGFSPLVVWSLVGLAGVGAGALVYFMLIRRSSAGGT